MLPVIAEHIEIAPGSAGGEAGIAGRGIKVRDVVIWHEKMGLSPREIVSRYPMLSMSDVHAALAYYYDRLHLSNQCRARRYPHVGTFVRS